MIAKAGDDSFVVKGIIHCHTEFSYDSKVTLANLCTKLRHDGFSFVALTEHAEGVTPQDYERFVADCRKESSDTFIAIPGLEILCDDGIEIAGIGISEFVEGQRPSDVISQIHRLGGYAVWVHPLKRGKWNGLFFDCDAIEVLNGKIDGILAPNLSLLRKVKEYRGKGENVQAIFGLDLHDLNDPLHVWTECIVSTLDSSAIIESLYKERFVNHLINGAVNSSGNMILRDFIRLAMLRSIYISWNTFLELLPNKIRKGIIQSSRPLVKIIKQKLAYRM